MKKQQTGFTLIEFAVVTILLGLLVGTALPRFSNLSTDVRKTTIEGARGTVRSAISIDDAVGTSTYRYIG